MTAAQKAKVGPEAQEQTMYEVAYNIYRRQFGSMRAARAFARSIRGGGCVVHSVRKI